MKMETLLEVIRVVSVISGSPCNDLTSSNKYGRERVACLPTLFVIGFGLWLTRDTREIALERSP